MEVYKVAITKNIQNRDIKYSERTNIIPTFIKNFLREILNTLENRWIQLFIAVILISICLSKLHVLHIQFKQSKALRQS